MNGFNVFAESTMLARLSIRQWTARKLDRRVTDKINAEHAAAADAGRYNKLLISGAALETVAKVANRARDIHYARTLPWADDGARILTAAGFLKYTAELGALRAEFSAAVDTFCAAYPDYVEAAKVRLNGMFNAADYPGAGAIRGRFEFDIGILPFPSAADFRVNLASDQADMIRREIEARTNAAVADAMRDAWQRVAENVGRMAERLRAYKPGENGERASGIFRDSLVGNVRDLADILPSLNITRDPALDRIAARMAAELCSDDADQLRDNETARASVADAAESILAEVSEFLA